MHRLGTDYLREGFLRFGSVLNAVASFAIFLIMLLVTADVFGRVLLNHPITGTPEIVKVAIVGIVFMQIPHTLWMKRHIRSEILVQRLGGEAREVVRIFASLLGLAVFLAIFVSSWGPSVTSWQLLEFEGEGAVRVPIYPIRTLILLASLMAAIIYIASLFHSVRIILHNLRRH